MERIPIQPREDWRETAEEHGFKFHSPEDDAYWDESAYYRFTLRQIEDDLEDPSEEIEQMCFAFVERAVKDDEVLRRLRIPEVFWEYVKNSWNNGEKNLYGRLDFAYDGQGPAKLYEYNADTPTALYESSIFQWVWLEQCMERGLIRKDADQFNSLHETLIEAFRGLEIDGLLHLACGKDSDEDWGTIEYLADCAMQAGLETLTMYVEDIGVDGLHRYTDMDDIVIQTLFKLYPWEWLMADEFGRHATQSGVRFIEPAWKALLSNKGLMPFLWEMFEGHPNLLPAWFEDDPGAAEIESGYVRKPILSREGANIEMFRDGKSIFSTAGDYGEEGFIVQALQPLPDFDGKHPMIGSWLVASRPCGICIREDATLVTTDDAHFIPHVILD